MILQRLTGESEIPPQPMQQLSPAFRDLQPNAGSNSGDTETKAFLNAAHTLDLYSVGAGNHVFRFRSISNQQETDSGEDLGIRARQLFIFQPLEGSEKNPSILGVDCNSRLTLCLYDPLSGKYKQGVFEPGRDLRKIKQLYAEKRAADQIGVNAILEDDSLVYNSFSVSGLNWNSARWIPLQDPQGQAAKAREIAVCGSSPAQGCLFAIGMEGRYEDRVLFAEDRFASTNMGDLGAPVIMGRWGKVKHISITVDTDKLINIFAVERQTGSIWVKKQNPQAPDKRVGFDYWKAVSEAPPFPIRRQRIHAMMQLNQQLRICCVEVDETLYPPGR